MTRIALVHQGYELYGSDRSFVEVVRSIRHGFPDAEITVVLPREGPILTQLRPLATRIVIEPIWVLRRKGLAKLATLGLLTLPVALLRAALRFARHDLVYVNTTVVADHLLVARLFRRKAMLHAHEIPEGFVRTVLRGLVAWSGASVIFNSRATEAAFALGPGRSDRVIYNGIAPPAADRPLPYDGTRPLRLLMLGRISRIKGQTVLLDAMERLPEGVRAKVELRIVGSAFEDEARERELAERVSALSRRAAVTLSPFEDDPSRHYAWADVVVVPSRLPESLGRVAIEAMAWSKPALVSRIGGLVEVVEDGVTGWLVPPDDAEALAARIATIVREPEPWRGFGEAGFRRYERLFSDAAVSGAIVDAVASRLGSRRAPVADTRIPVPGGRAP